MPVRVSTRARSKERDPRRRFSRRSSTFHTERLRVTTEDGERPLRIFFKDPRPEHQVTDARGPLRFRGATYRRELDMCRSILSRER